MKFTVSSSDLLFHVQKAYSAISNKPVMSILENFKFEVNQGLLTIIGTDVETTIITSLPVEAEDEFSFTMPAGIIHDTLKALPTQPVTVAYEDENRNITITASSGEYNLVGEPVDEFPERKEKETKNSLILEAQDFIQAVNHTSFATSTDDVRTAMQGIYIEIDYDKINFVATDAHKLVKFTKNNITSEFTEGVILPKKSAMLVKNTIHPDADLKIYATKSNLFFETEGTEIVCRLIDSQYPNYNTVIPNNNTIELIINRKELLNSLKRIIIYANKTTSGVTFNLEEDLVQLKAQDLDFYNKASEQVKANYKGESMKIGFSAKYLIDMLNVLETDEVKVLMSSPSRPSLVVPVDDDEDEDILMLLMPLVIQNM